MAKSVLASNPLRIQRDALNLTQEKLATLAGVSPNTLYLAESGVYETPLEPVVRYFIEVADIDPVKLFDDYKQFRLKIQALTRNVMHPALWSFSVPIEQTTTLRSATGKRIAPIADFRVNVLKVPVTSFVKTFLINPGLLDRLEAGKVFGKVPKPIADALRECGAPAPFIKELYDRTALFKASCL